MKKQKASVEVKSDSGKKVRPKSILGKHKPENGDNTIPPKSETAKRKELFGKQLSKWRIRAGITDTEAGNKAFNTKGIDSASAKRRWQRYEKGEFPALNAKELKNICAAVGGHPRLGGAILGKPFTSWKESEHILWLRSPDRKLNDSYDEDGFEDEIETYIFEEKPESDSDEDSDFSESTKVNKKTPKKKSAEQKEADRLAVTKEFLVNRRRKGEFDERPTDTSDYTPSGTSLNYMVNPQTFETEDDLKHERNPQIEKFFENLLDSNEDVKFNALQDLWLSFLGRKEKGLELLEQIIEFYGKNSLNQSNTGQKLIYKYAAHYATNLLFHLYKLAYNPLNVKSSDYNLTGKKLESYSAVGKFAEKISRIPQMVEGPESQRKFLIGFYKTTYKALPAEARLELKKDFSRIVFALAPGDKAKDYMKTPEMRAALKNDFKVLAMTCLSELYYLEKEVYYLLNEEERSAIKIEQHRFIDVEMKESHTLFRFYYMVKPQDFLTNLWLLQDTFDLYNIKLREKA